MTDHPLIRVEGLAKIFPGAQDSEDLTVFDDIWFSVDKSGFVCLIGHSGCGKTTLLNILAGLDQASGGGVIVGGEEVTGPSIEHAVVFQSHALMPWMTVMSNIAFAVKSRWPSWPRAKVVEQCQKFIDLVHLTGSEYKKPAQLSRGMKQRVGIARAMAIDPRVMLLDEPFSALDALTRGSLQDGLLTICTTTSQTVFMITHDIDEAILLADKIVLMTNGPQARVCELVENTLPRDRTRHNMHRHQNYYPLRNHLIDFLVNRSAQFKDELSSPDYDPRHPPVVRPMADGDASPSRDTGRENAIAAAR